MTEKLPFTINELVEKPWNKMVVYHLTDEQKEELINHKRLLKREYIFRKGYEWEEHSHEQPQLLLVIKGELVHRANNNGYAQNPDDLLIVPANIPHTAYADKDLVLYWFTKNE